MEDPASATPPDPARGSHSMTFSVCLTFDFDAVSVWTESFRAVSPSQLSRGEYGPRTALPRILDTLRAEQIPATFFVPVVTAEQFPDSIAAIVAAGHEIAAHGDRHERVAKLGRDAERGVLERCVSGLERATGERPVGYRCPGWEISPNTIALLEELDFIYDSSQMATDFTPYLSRRDDRVDDDRRWLLGTESTVWELPVAWELDDFPYFVIQPPNLGPGRNPEDVFAMWRAEYDAARRLVPDGVFTLTMHPQVIGRGPRLAVLERLIEHIRAGEQAEFRTARDAVATYASRDDT
jgi:peptidoglycan/xylan/chitin deacetylase (PgdA/CDA1 family)